MNEQLSELLRGTPYVAYSYAYPHKTAYRRLTQPRPLADLWAGEERSALFLYLHVPFCEMRCGFCNLFTTVHPQGDIVADYLATLRREAQQVRAALGPAHFARLAIGGGTPTYLEPAQLHQLFAIVTQLYAIDLTQIPISVETSPQTADPARLRVLREHHVDRISIGVQSFIEREVAAVGRSQQTAHVERALSNIREAGFPTLNIDLIYGIPGQSVASWQASLEAALRYQPEELYLYPLYVRPLTGLGRRDPRAAQDDAAWDELRLACYRTGRDLLRAAGYTQTSMRMFRAPHAPAPTGPLYCCQDDGMVGLGCGARSYTRSLHYSSEYAVSASGVRTILADYIRRSAATFAAAHYGIALDAEEQRRRYIIQSLLQVEGLAFAAYWQRFGSAALSDLPMLAELEQHGLATTTSERLRLNDAGIERSDTIGPWLYTRPVRESMAEFELH